MAQPPPSFHLSDFENLQEDLVLLQTSMQQRRVDPKRAQSQCVEILGAVAEITQEQQLPEYAGFVQHLVGFVDEEQAALIASGEAFWALTLDVLDELLAALEMADAGLKIDEDAMRRHITVFEERLTDLRTGSENGEAATAAPSEGEQPANKAEEAASDMVNFEMAEDEGSPPAPEEADEQVEASAGESQTASDSDREDAHALLQRAAEAAAAGHEDEAQTLAARATELLAVQVRERKVAQLEELRNQCHVLVSEVESTEGELSESAAECERLHAAAAEAQAFRDETEAAFVEQAQVLEEAKAELEDVEKRMAELQQTQREMMERFDEALPAKEAAERACEHARDEATALETSLKEEEARQADIKTGLADAISRREQLEQQLETLERELGA